VYLAVLQARGQSDASFFLMPARFWELAAGALVWLYLSRRPQQPTRAAPAWCASALLALLVILMFTPESWRVAATLVCVACSVGLLILLRSETGPGRWLSKPGPLAIGLSSYLLYLWHWPVIVLAGWSVGINRLTLLPILLLIGLLTWLSYASYASAIRNLAPELRRPTGLTDRADSSAPPRRPQRPSARPSPASS
jgi:peptidoglycan/LPS O-acetylase OafA/YrhL